MVTLVRDDFTDDRRRGRVLGTAAVGQPSRQGRDVERVLSIDGGALRIQPPLREGWERTCLSYGPFPAKPGLTFAVFMLNGHNTSQAEVMSDSLRTRLERWARGSGVDPTGRRLWRWLRSGRVRRVLRQMRWWARIATGSSRVTPMDDNLAIGFQAGAVVHPEQGVTGFLMRATGPENGELRVVGGPRNWPVIRGVQNVPIHYVARLRERDVLCLASGPTGARGLGGYPALRPLAVLARPDGEELRTAVHQSLLGQIGFRADSRVYGVRVTQDAGAGSRWAGALAAAAADQGTLPPATAASVGGSWLPEGEVAWLRTGAAAGLLRLCLKPTACLVEPLGLRWGRGSGADGWELRLEASRLVLCSHRGEGRNELAVVERAGEARPPQDVQVLDDGQEITIIVDGGTPFGRPWRAAGPVGGTGVGLAGSPAALAEVLSWEVLPRELPLPPDLDAGPPWSAAGDAVILADDLGGPPGDLAGRSTPVGAATWRRLLGPGRLECDGRGGARWAASADAPLAGRTIYTLDWNQPGFADLTVTLTPPGTARGQREHGTAGFCLWQDDDNYLLINTWLDDCYGGASLSSFLKLDGFEDLYDAIWTNVGDRVTWGRPLRLRLVSDGRRYQVHIDGEPVLYRALDDIYPGRLPLRIARVGLLGNWEWGADTGSRFADFEARGRRPEDS